MKTSFAKFQYNLKWSFSYDTNLGLTVRLTEVQDFHLSQILKNSVHLEDSFHLEKVNLPLLTLQNKGEVMPRFHKCVSWDYDQASLQVNQVSHLVRLGQSIKKLNNNNFTFFHD